MKKSPRKKASGKVNRFKKILDDQARRQVRRAVHILNDNQRKYSPKKVLTQKKLNKRLINGNRDSYMGKRKFVKHKSQTNSQGFISLEEGEIRSDIEKSVANTTATDTLKHVEHLIDNYDDDDDDDCIVIEPTLEEITIDDDDIPSTSDVSTNYQSLIHSFQDCVSSTPCNKQQGSSVMAANSTNIEGSSNLNADETLPFFVDVGGRKSGLETINSTDTFTDYTKLSALTDSSQKSQRTVRLSENTCDTIIDLDDSGTESTLKRKSTEIDDDSVIFISETNEKDFIPIADVNMPPHKILKISEDAPLTAVNSRLRSNNILYTRKETKKLTEYNENAYNPCENQVLTTGKRMVILDGSNVAFKHGLDQVFSVKGLKIAIEYFEKMGHEVKAVIPQFRMNKGKSTNHEELERLHKAGKIVQTPCKNLPGLTATSYDDRFVLQLAFELDAAIVSNDNYRDLLHENPAFKKIVEKRVIGYTWCNDIFILPKDPYGKWGPQLHTILNRT